MFKLFSNNRIKDDQEAIRKLIEISCFGVGDENSSSKDIMDKILSTVEEYSCKSNNAQLFYWLGVAWRNYTAWHIKGEQKKPYLEKTINYFKKSFEFATSQLPIRYPSNIRNIEGNLDQLKIASEIGILLVNVVLVRNLEEAEKWLSFVYNNTQTYEPCFCYYAELYYKLGDYEKCAEIAMDSHERAKKDDINDFNDFIKTNNEHRFKISTMWDNVQQKYIPFKEYAETHDPTKDIAPAPLEIAGKAYRALGKKAKKEGQVEDVKSVFKG